LFLRLFPLLLPLLLLLTLPLALLLLLQPFEFTAGESISVSTRVAGDTAGGLFAGGSGPKPPPALSTAVIGMKQGGRVRSSSSLMHCMMLAHDACVQPSAPPLAWHCMMRH
jgi:hypothetical protein